MKTPEHQRIAKLEVALRNLVDAARRAGEDSVGIFVLAAAHGINYTGATCKKELAAADEVLAGRSEDLVEKAEAAVAAIKAASRDGRLDAFAVDAILCEYGFAQRPGEKGGTDAPVS